MGRRKSRDLSGLAIRVTTENPNMLVPWYLMLSYLYYAKDVSAVSDDCYDTICQRLYSEWDHVRHFHKSLVDQQALRAGTGYYLTWDRSNPTHVRVMGAADALLAMLG